MSDSLLAQKMGQKILAAAEKTNTKINTFDIGKILNFYPADLSCDVQLKWKSGDDPVTLYKVPLMTFSYGGAGLIITPSTGDHCLVGYTKYTLRDQLQPEVSNVNSISIFNQSSAFVIMGVYSKTEEDLELMQSMAISANMVLLRHSDGHEFRVSPATSLVQGQMSLTYNVTDGVSDIVMTDDGNISITAQKNVIIDGKKVEITGLDINTDLTSIDGGDADDTYS